MSAADPLALAVVGLPGWRWRAGMRDTNGRRYYDSDETPAIIDEVQAPRSVQAIGGTLFRHARIEGAIPDLDDEATGGCLLAMVLALDPGASVESLGREPVIYVDTGDDSDTPCAGSTLARACAAALVAVGRCA